MVQTGAGHGADGRPHPRRGQARQISCFRADGGTAMGTWLNLCQALFASIGEPRPEARHPAHRRREPQRDARRSSTWRSRTAPGQLPVRLPRRRRRLEGGRGPQDRHGPARHGRHHPATRSDWPPSSQQIMRKSMARGVADAAAAGLGAAGRAGAVRPPGLPDRRGPHPARGAPVNPLTMRLPDRLVGRRGARLPRRRPAGGQGGRPGAAGGPRPAGRRRRACSRRAW